MFPCYISKTTPPTQTTFLAFYAVSGHVTNCPEVPVTKAMDIVDIKLIIPKESEVVNKI